MYAFDGRHRWGTLRTAHPIRRVGEADARPSGRDTRAPFASALASEQSDLRAAPGPAGNTAGPEFLAACLGWRNHIGIRRSCPGKIKLALSPSWSRFTAWISRQRCPSPRMSWAIFVRLSPGRTW